MKAACIWEHNGDDSLVYCRDYPGAYARGATREQALAKIPSELQAYAAWRGMALPSSLRPVVVQEKASELCIRDADSDVLFDAECAPLTRAEYEEARRLTMQSAQSFEQLYRAVPDVDASCLPERSTFYGTVPRTAREMYLHTKNVNEYYFREIGVAADNVGTIVQCREKGFALLEQQADFLKNPVLEGSYQEQWSLRKVLRRFVWHDRIHARAMYRMALQTFGTESVPDIFCFLSR